MASENQNLRAELRRELERIGLPRAEAEDIASRQISDDAARQRGESSSQHVVPVSRGWIIVRDPGNLDLGLFEDKESAIEEATKLARDSNARVIVHDN